MNKYNFGYELQENSTTQWAFNKVKKNSKVLELGPANGNLTKHLKEQMNCIVDIIEISNETGILASQFARKAFIGTEAGNIENYHWYEALKNEKYDYIIILDVLEHLLQPNEVLKRLRELLKEDGSILISIPNIAHNSIIIDLINNRFNYNELGLLDNTHLKFFTYETLNKLFDNIGMVAVDKDYILLGVGENEIKNSYAEVEQSIAYYLRQRYMADVYQFTFEFKDSNKYKEGEFKYRCADITKNRVNIYVKEQGDNEFSEDKVIRAFVGLELIQFNLDLHKYKNIEEIRIDLFLPSGLIWDYGLWTDFKNTIEEVPLKQCNGCILPSRGIIHEKETLQIIYNISQRQKESLKFECKFKEFKLEACKIISEYGIEAIRIKELRHNNKKLKISHDELNKKYIITEKERARISKEYHLLEISREELNTRYIATEKERARVSKECHLLEVSREELNIRYIATEKERERVTADYNQLDQVRNEIFDKYTQLQGAYNIIHNKCDDLESKYREQVQEINRLNSSVNKQEEDNKALNISLRYREDQIEDLERQLKAIYDSQGWIVLTYIKKIKKYIESIFRR